MSTYFRSGSFPQSARYVGQFVPSDDTSNYYYSVVAYDRNSLAIATPTSAISAVGPAVLDGDHAISIQWSPVIGATFYNVFKSVAGPPPTDGSILPFWNATGSETGVLDVGYPCTTRNSFLNLGTSPVFMVATIPTPVQPENPCADPAATDPCTDVPMPANCP